MCVVYTKNRPPARCAGGPWRWLSGCFLPADNARRAMRPVVHCIRAPSALLVSPTELKILAFSRSDCEARSILRLVRWSTVADHPDFNEYNRTPITFRYGTSNLKSESLFWFFFQYHSPSGIIALKYKYITVLFICPILQSTPKPL